MRVDFMKIMILWLISQEISGPIARPQAAWRSYFGIFFLTNKKVNPKVADT